MVFTPQKFNVPWSMMWNKTGLISFKINVTYIGRQAAPTYLEVIFSNNRSSLLLPTKDGYESINEFFWIEPKKIIIPMNKTMEVIVYINVTYELISILEYQARYGSNKLSLSPIYIIIPANQLLDKASYKYICATNMDIEVYYNED